MTTSENHIPDPIHDTFVQYDQWRVKFLRIVLWVVCGFGFFILGAVIPSASTTEAIIFGGIYFTLVIVTFLPLSYTIKAGTLLIVGYFIGAFTLFRFGPWSDSTLFFLATTIFASLLFDRKVDRIMLALTSITLIGAGILDVSKFHQLSEANLPPLNSFDWLTYIVDYIVLAIAAVWAINLLRTDFKTVSERLQKTLVFVSKEHAELEHRVEERTSDLVKKTDQLRAASYIARKTAESRDLYSLLGSVTELITDHFGYYHTGIFLMSEAGDEVILQAASSEGGKRMLEKGHSLQVGSQGIVGFAAAQKNPHIALDVGVDAVYFNNPDLPMTRSEIALPLLADNKVLGVLDIQSDQPQAFRMDDIDVFQTLADQMAIAIENTRLLNEARAALLQIESLTTVRTREEWKQKLQGRSLTYTYSPLGLRIGGNSEKSDEEIKIPITLRGQNIGSISLSRKDGFQWNDTDMDMISEVAYQTGLAVDNVRLVDEATQRAKQEQTIGELAARFSQSMDIDSLLQIAARELGQVADVSEVSVYIGNVPEQVPQKRYRSGQQVNK